MKAMKHQMTNPKLQIISKFENPKTETRSRASSFIISDLTIGICLVFSACDLGFIPRVEGDATKGMITKMK
jgi:hypothetical protein